MSSLCFDDCMVHLHDLVIGDLSGKRDFYTSGRALQGDEGTHCPDAIGSESISKDIQLDQVLCLTWRTPCVSGGTVRSTFAAYRSSLRPMVSRWSWNQM